MGSWKMTKQSAPLTCANGGSKTLSEPEKLAVWGRRNTALQTLRKGRNPVENQPVDCESLDPVSTSRPWNVCVPRLGRGIVKRLKKTRHMSPKKWTATSNGAPKIQILPEKLFAKQCEDGGIGTRTKFLRERSATKRRKSPSKRKLDAQSAWLFSIFSAGNALGVGSLMAERFILTTSTATETKSARSARGTNGTNSHLSNLTRTPRGRNISCSALIATRLNNLRTVNIAPWGRCA